jgi:chromosome segregation ATPase
MAPKKGKDGGKKDKGKKEGEASAEMTEKELLQQAQLRIEALEQQLVWREEKTDAALRGQKELQERITHYHADFEREKEEIFDISADMTRQYKGMQEELIAQVNKLEQTIAEQKDELERAQLQLEEVRRQMANELALKDAEIKEQKDKMEDMAVEFGEARSPRSPRSRRPPRARQARRSLALRPLTALLPPLPPADRVR